MSTSEPTTGRCLCGAITYETTSPVRDVLQCHCSNCRQISGNYVAAVRTQTVDLTMHDPSNRLREVEVSEARYGFCEGCGSTLFFRPDERPDDTSLMVGTLDNAPQLAVQAVWFADEAQPHNELPQNVPHHAGNG